MILRLLVCFLFLPIVSISQNSYDSLKLIWENENNVDSIRFGAIAEQYQDRRDLTKNLELTDYHFKLSQRKKSEQEKYEALHSKSITYYFLGEIEETKKAFKQELQLAKEINDPKVLLRSYLIGGSIEIDARNFLEGIRYFNSGSKIARANGFKEGEITCLNNLAAVYQLIGNYELSLKYLDEAENRSIKHGLKSKLGLIWLNKGNTHYSKKNFGESIALITQALSYFNKTNDIYYQSSCYYVLASCYHQLGDNKQALVYLDNSQEIDQSTENELRELEGLTLRGKILVSTDANEALKIGRNVLSRIDDETPHDIRKGAFELLYECYKKVDDFKKALEMHEMFLVSKDSMQFEETNFATIREAVSHEFEIELYETQLKNEKEQSQLKLTQTKRNYLIVSIAVILILLIVSFFRRKSIQLKKKRDDLLKEIEKLKQVKPADNQASNHVFATSKFTLNREKIEASISRKLNTTDWKVLQILLEDPVITNKEIASQAFLSEDGIGSSLRRMYNYFEVKETKYKKIALLMDAIKRSNN